MVNEFGEEVDEEDYDADVSEGSKKGRIRNYFGGIGAKMRKRGYAARSEQAQKEGINYENYRPGRDALFGNRKLKELDDLELAKLSPEERLKYDKVAYAAERNSRFKNWAIKKGGAGFSEAYRGEAPKEGKAGRIGSALMGIGKRNPLTSKGRGNLERGGLEKAKIGITHAGAAMGAIGGAFGEAGAQSFQPVKIFTMAWERMSVTLKWLIIIVFLVVILFVPWGVFYYTGWAVGAAFMFLISLIYWGFASFFNAIAYVLVTAINAVASIIMGIIIWIVEAFMSWFMKPNYQNPKTKAYEYYWVAGHDLFDNALLKYSDVATVPTLMHVVTPSWQPWMNQILIVKLFEIIPGASAIVNSFKVIGDAMGNAFSQIIVHSPPWMVILIGLLPVILVIAIGIVVYKKYKNEAAL